MMWNGWQNMKEKNNKKLSRWSYLRHTIIINISVVRFRIVRFSFHSFCHKMLKLLLVFKLWKWGSKWWSFIYLCGIIGNRTWRWVVWFWQSRVSIWLQCCIRNTWFSLITFFWWLNIFGRFSISVFLHIIDIGTWSSFWVASWGKWLLWSRLSVLINNWFWWMWEKSQSGHTTCFTSAADRPGNFWRRRCWGI